jgi:hypothetical protein
MIGFFYLEEVVGNHGFPKIRRGDVNIICLFDIIVYITFRILYGTKRYADYMEYIEMNCFSHHRYPMRLITDSRDIIAKKYFSFKSLSCPGNSRLKRYNRNEMHFLTSLFYRGINRLRMKCIFLKSLFYHSFNRFKRNVDYEMLSFPILPDSRSIIGMKCFSHHDYYLMRVITDSKKRKIELFLF